MKSHFAIDCSSIFVKLTQFDLTLSYLIDFEVSRYQEDYKPTSWEDVVAHFDHPDAILQQWGLVTRELEERLDRFRRQRRNGEQSRSATEHSQSASGSRTQSRGTSRDKNRSPG